MPRIALGLEYKGTNYHGWQAQDNPKLPTIQEYLETVLSKIANHSVVTVCAGRTDAKVHAISQVVHFDTKINRKLAAWVLGANRYLPEDIKILWSKEVGKDFNARTSANYRTYYYFIYNSNAKPGLFNNYVAWEYKSLNIATMQQASLLWLGEHDFASFRGRDCQSKSSIRRVEQITITKINNCLIKIIITANAFLQHMVRNMVGTLIKIGQEINPPEWAKELLLAKNRALVTMMAPAEGLYLADVRYPEQFDLPKVTRGFSIL